jgi:hypothetical protein
MSNDLRAAAERLRQVEYPGDAIAHGNDEGLLAHFALALLDETPIDNLPIRLDVAGMDTRIERLEASTMLLVRQARATGMSLEDCDIDELDVVALPITTLGQLRSLLHALQGATVGHMQ